mgnify:CR=1 FL=1
MLPVLVETSKRKLNIPVYNLEHVRRKKGKKKAQTFHLCTYISADKPINLLIKC